MAYVVYYNVVQQETLLHCWQKFSGNMQHSPTGQAHQHAWQESGVLHFPGDLQI